MGWDVADGLAPVREGELPHPYCCRPISAARLPVGGLLFLCGDELAVGCGLLFPRATSAFDYFAFPVEKEFKFAQVAVDEQRLTLITDNARIPSVTVVRPHGVQLVRLA